MYSYQAERDKLFTDAGQRKLLLVRDTVAKCLKLAGAVRQQEALCGVTGNSWESMACLDRLIELGEIREITGNDVPGQYRVFVSARQDG